MKYGRPNSGAKTPSPGKFIAVASRIAEVSRTVCETTCWIETPHSSLSGPIGTLPLDGFRPTSPHIAAGILMEPPPSLALAAGRKPAATAAAEPPDEPPGP